MKNRQFFIVGVLAAVMSTIGFFLYRPRYLRSFVPLTDLGEVKFAFDTIQPVLALTIDDGPHPTLTPQVLDLLAKYNIKATFFLLADHIEENRAIVERMVAEGHEIGNHMLTDKRSIALSPYEFDRQIKLADGILRQFQQRVNWYRPGWALYNKRMLDCARGMGYKTVLGSVYPYDANLPGQVNGVDFIVSYILENCHPGGIIVLHDGLDSRFRLLDVLPLIIPALLEKGYRFGTLTELEKEFGNQAIELSV